MNAAISLKKCTVKPLRLQKAAVNTTHIDALFENLPKLLSPKQVEELNLASVKTVYDWKYRPTKYDCPPGLFAPKRTLGSDLRILRDVLKAWVASWEVT